MKGLKKMKALVVVDGGIRRRKGYGGQVCGFQTRVHAESDDPQNVTFKIASWCEKARKLAEALMARGPVDGYAEIGARSDGVVLTTSNEALKGCCAGCGMRFGLLSKHCRKD